MPHWCAAAKISYLNNYTKPTLNTLLSLWEKDNNSASILVVSCGAKEQELSDYLKSIGFKKWPNMINYGHSSGKTWLMVYQIPKKYWKKTTGYNGKGNWTRTY